MRDDVWETAEVHHRQLSPSPDAVELTFLETVAELKDCDISDLPRLWPALDGHLQSGFSTPPAESADIEMEFTYAGYRVRLNQSGTAALVELPTEAE